MTERATHILQHLVTFLMGAGAVMLLLPITHFSNVRNMDVQRDTVEKKVYVSYNGIDLKKNTYEMKLPEFGKLRAPLYFYVPKDSVRVEYRDTGKTRTEYIVLPRKAYHTKMSDIDIYHSGVESSIDSVAFSYNQQTITEQWVKMPWKHEISIYVSAGYCGLPRLPIGADYTYYPKRWIGFGGKVEYDVLQQKTSILATAKIRFGW